MRIDSLKAAREEAYRFIRTTDAVLRKLPPYESRHFGEQAVLVRHASLDLTRALAVLRTTSRNP